MSQGRQRGSRRYPLRTKGDLVGIVRGILVDGDERRDALALLVLLRP